MKPFDLYLLENRCEGLRAMRAAVQGLNTWQVESVLFSRGPIYPGGRKHDVLAWYDERIAEADARLARAREDNPGLVSTP